MKTLNTVTFKLPKNNSSFITDLATYFNDLITKTNNGITLKQSEKYFLPFVKFEETAIGVPEILFDSDTEELISVKLMNDTQRSKSSPHTYSLITLSDFLERVGKYRLGNIDHVGFNLPWFENDIHPSIKKLRSVLSKSSLYHTFPTGEPWDFIIPGYEDEIIGKTKVDYSISRKPKIEIVSFDKSSTPLIQLDLSIEASYSEIEKLFPEGIAVPEIKNVWVYLENPYGVDFCLVVNEPSKKDWSDFFAQSRLLI